MTFILNRSKFDSNIYIYMFKQQQAHIVSYKLIDDFYNVFLKMRKLEERGKTIKPYPKRKSLFFSRIWQMVMWHLLATTNERKGVLCVVLFFASNIIATRFNKLFNIVYTVHFKYSFYDVPMTTNIHRALVLRY